MMVPDPRLAAIARREPLVTSQAGLARAARDHAELPVAMRIAHIGPGDAFMMHCGFPCSSPADDAFHGLADDDADGVVGGWVEHDGLVVELDAEQARQEGDRQGE